MINKGQTLVCGKDVARAIGYKIQKALRVHVSLEDKGVNEMVTPWWNATIHLHQRVRSLLPRPLMLNEGTLGIQKWTTP